MENKEKDLDLKDEDKKVEDKKVEDNQGTDGDTKPTDVKPEDIKEQIRLELEREYEEKQQSEIDRRVTEAIKKREEKLLAEQEEKERLAKLSEQERLEEERKQFLKESTKRERELIKKELQLDLIDQLTENEMDLGFRDIISLDDLVGLDEEERVKALGEKVKGVKELFEGVLDKEVEKTKAEYLKGKTPANLGEGNVKPEDDYEKAKKSGNIKEMIRIKRERG